MHASYVLLKRRVTLEAPSTNVCPKVWILRFEGHVLSHGGADAYLTTKYPKEAECGIKWQVLCETVVV